MSDSLSPNSDQYPKEEEALQLANDLQGMFVPGEVPSIDKPPGYPNTIEEVRGSFSPSRVSQLTRDFAEKAYQQHNPGVRPRTVVMAYILDDPQVWGHAVIYPPVLQVRPTFCWHYYVERGGGNRTRYKYLAMTSALTSEDT